MQETPVGRNLNPNCKEVTKHFKRCKGGELKITQGIRNDLLVFCSKHGHLHTLTNIKVCDFCLDVCREYEVGTYQNKQICVECAKKVPIKDAKI